MLRISIINKTILRTSIVNGNIFSRLLNTTATIKAASGPAAGTKHLIKQGAVAKKIKLPVETDTVKLVTFVCGSDYNKENPKDIEIKDNSEYPDWLWEVRLEKAPPLYTMEPTTKNYWRRMKRQVYFQLQRIRATKKF